MPDLAPDLLLTYIPHLDYDLQRHGPDSEPAAKALDILLGYLTRLKAACAGLWLRLDFRGRLRHRAGETRRGLSRTARCARRGFSACATSGAWPTPISSPARRLPWWIIRSRTSIAATRRRSPARESVSAGAARRGRGARPRGAEDARHRPPRAAAISCWWPRTARGSPIRGSRKRKRRTTPATSISTTSPATIRANFSSAGRRAA